MNFLKTLGLGMYYRARRISKAFKNWKKFGVVIFGSMFLAGSMFPGLSQAADALRVEVYRNNQAISGLIVDAGSSTQFTAKAFLGTQDVTGSTNFIWAINGQYQISDIGTISTAGLYHAGNTDGFYSGAIQLMGIYSGGGQDSDSISITINPVTPPANDLAISITPSTTQTVSVNQTVPFTPSVTWNGGAAKSGTKVDWYVNNALVSTLTYPNVFSYSRSTVGTAQISARAKYNPGTGEVMSGFSNKTTVNVISAPEARLERVEIYRNNQAISGLIVDTNSQTQFTAKAFDTTGKDITGGTQFTWAINGQYQISDIGTISTAGLYHAGNTDGFYSGAIQLMGIYSGGGQDSDSISITINPVTPPANDLTISITPSTTQTVSVNQTVPFTPSVTWNGGAALSGTQVDWYVNNMKQVTLLYPQQFMFSSAVAGVSVIHAVARYQTATSNQSNSTTVVVEGVGPKTLSVDILEDSETLVLQNGQASRLFHFAAYLGGDAYTPVSKLWTVTGGGTIDPVTGLYTTTSTSNAVTIRIHVEDSDGQEAEDTLTFNVVTETENVRRLATVTLEPAVYGPVLSGTAVPYIAHGWDTDGDEIDAGITFTWHWVNSTIGTLTTMQTGYNQSTILNTHATVVTGTYHPLYATGHFTDSTGTTWNIPSAVAELRLTQMITQDVLQYVTAVANPTSIYVGGDISTLTAQAYGSSGPLTNNVSYVWDKLSGPTSFVGVNYGQSIQIMSNTTTGTATYQVTATYQGDTASKSALVYVTVLPHTDHTLTVRITPDPVYGEVKTNQSMYATVRYDGVDVSDDAFIDWTMLDHDAGNLVDEDQADATLRTSNDEGTYPSAVRVYATYADLSATDTATVVVTDDDEPVRRYWLDWSLNGVIEDGSTPSEDDVIVYTLRLTNNQDNTIHDTQVNVDVPTYTTFLSATSAVDHPRIYNRTITWDAGSFTDGQSKTMKFRVVINEDLPKNGVSITAYGRVTADEIAGFNIHSNTIRVGAGSGTTTPTGGDLPSTGTDAIVLGLLAVISLGLSVLVYRWMNRRAANAILTEQPDTII